MPEDESQQPEISPIFGADALANHIRVRSEDFFTIYANNVALVFSTWDLSVILGEILGESDGKPVVEETLKISMTREFAKVFSQILSTNIAAYEKQFGEIK